MSSSVEKITFGDNLPGYILGPSTAPGVVVVQEWWGITEAVKEQATLIANEGFQCLIPDLYKGKIGVDAEEASHMMNHLDFKKAIEEITSAVDYLKSRGAAKVGCVGFCMGGALTFCAAQHSGVSAAVPFYGTPDPALCQVDEITVPVQAHFGKLDSMKGFSDPETRDKVIEQMKAKQRDVELFVYDSAGHGFMNGLVPDGRKLLAKANNPVPKEEEVQEAFARMIAFFKKHLA